MELLANKRALVCGATQGIGKAIAICYSKLGASVTLLARDMNKLEIVKQELAIENHQVHDYLVADFTNPKQVQEQVQHYLASHPPFHILVNNTGGPATGPLINATASEFTKAFDQHLIVNHLLTQVLFLGMCHEKYGRIINILSTSVKQPIANLGVSNTIRGAVANWAKTMANELAPFGITVNNILPGSTNTDRLHDYYKEKANQSGKSVAEIQESALHKIPLQRFAEADEVAYAACYLASPQAAYVTGINLPVDGGKVACL